MKFVNILLTISICMTAIIGDNVVSKSKYSDILIFRAVVDNFVHAAIGFLSSLLFFNQGINVSSQAYIYNVVFCTIISSLIDIDHFIVAKSIYLKDLENLKQRGLFHCTTFWIIITLSMLTFSYMRNKLNIYILTYMLIIAFTSHHIRDGNRRGLWLYPFGHTPAIHRYLYIFLLAVLPVLYFYLYEYIKPVNKYIVVYKELV